MNQVTQLHKMEMLDDIHQRKGTSARNDRGRPKVWGRRMPVWHQDAGGLPVALTVMAGGLAAEQCNTMGASGLCMTTEGGSNHPSWGWGHGPNVLATTGAPSPVSPWVGTVHSSRCWCRRQPPSTITADAIITTTTTITSNTIITTATTITTASWGSRALPPAHSQMDRVVCQVCPGSVLVGRGDASPRPHGLSGVCLEGACLLWGTCSMQPGKEGEKSLHTTCSASLNWQTSLPTTEGREVCQPWHLPQLGTAYHCLSDGFAVLGQMGASPSPWPTSSSGEDHAGTLVGNGTACFFWGGRGLCNHSTSQLDGSYPTTVDGDHATVSTGIPEVPHP